MPDPMRITLKQNDPNPLIRKWLQELLEEAKAKNSKLTNMLEEALNSVSKYPVPIKSGAECAILKGFGKKLCLFLDQRLQIYYSNMKSNENSKDEIQLNMTNGNNMIFENVQIKTEKIDMANVVHNDNNMADNLNNQQNKLKRKESSQRSPGFTSAACAILVALLNNMKQNPNKISFTKEEIIEKAQPLFEGSFIRGRTDTFCKSWASISKLLIKELVISKQSLKHKVFQLSNLGIKFAEELLREYENKDKTNDLINKAVSHTSHGSVAITPRCLTDVTEVIEFPRGSHNIILLIDKQETSGLVVFIFIIINNNI